MSPDLFSQAASAADFPNRAVSPRDELGAYEALWARQDTGLKSIAEAFSGHAGAIPASVGGVVRQRRDSKTRAAHSPLMRRIAQKLSC